MQGGDKMTGVFENIIHLEDDSLKNRYLTFSIGQETYGIEVRYVVEIVAIQKITELPDFPDYLKGIINLRGKIIPVMDVRLRFKKEAIDYNVRTCIIVVDIKGTSIGLIVDTVSEVITISEQDIVELLDINKNINNKCVKKIGKVGKDIKLLVDCEQLLSEDELIDIQDAI